MSKAYWVTWYRTISDPEAHARYTQLAGPAIRSFGGKFLVRGMSSVAPERGTNERAVVIEFDSIAQALAAYHSPAYQAALSLLANTADREVRIFEVPQPEPG
jgi:uncharacterized protein (DUF1330 family)